MSEAEEKPRKMALVFKRMKKKYNLIDGEKSSYMVSQYCVGWTRDDGTWFATEIPPDILDEIVEDILETDDVPF